MSLLSVVAAVAAALGALLLVAGARRLRRRSLMRGGADALAGTTLLGIGVALGLLAVDLHTYERLTAEAPVAELAFEEVGSQRFQATVEYPSGETARYLVHGDEWQLDARILKWEGYAVLAGFDTRYRLERLSGRYRAIDEARARARSVHLLSDERAVDLRHVATRYQRWLPWVDVRYGGAAYMPMADGARYRVSVTSSGLVARPGNEAAVDAVAGWR